MTEKERRKDMRNAYRRAERQRRIDLCPLTEARLRSLVDHIDTKVLDVGCDQSTRHAVSWAESEGLEWTDLALVRNVQSQQAFLGVRERQLVPDSDAGPR